MILDTFRQSARVRRLSLLAITPVLVAGLLCGAGWAGAAPSLALARSTSKTVVKPCAGHAGVLCGNITVPLFWNAPHRGSLTVHFKEYLRTDRSLPALEPIVAMEGGPGYPSTRSAASYLFMIGSLRQRHDLILMDQRGTGGSHAINCPGAQNYDGLVRPDDFPAVVAACAKKLGAKANAFGTAAVARDLKAVLKTLQVRKVDLYGDSYGSYAAQVFAVRFPGLVRDLVLDGTYYQQFNPFEPEAVTALRRAWDTMCTRYPGCQGHDLLGDIGATARKLARHPVVGVADDEYGTPQHIDLTAKAFAQLVLDATYSYTFFRDLPAALAAARHGDLAPLKRLAAEDVSFNAGGGAPRGYSAGDLEAVSCHDYPTAWDTRSGDARRAAQLEKAIRRLPTGVFSPFTKKTWLGSLDENELVYGCLDWPRPAVADPPFRPGARFPHTPVLVLDGLLDQATPLGDASKVAKAWPDATLVRVANSNHVTAQADFLHCVSGIVRQFLRTRSAGSTSCAHHVPAQYVVPAFPTRVGTAPQARRASSADHSAKLGRQAAWVATQTIGDALERWFNLIGGGPEYGLYGGSLQVSGAYYSYKPLVLRFKATRFVPDLSVSGTARWNRASSRLKAKVSLTGPHGLTGSLQIGWSTSKAGAIASVRGTVGGRSVSLRTPAPFSAHG